MNKKVCILLGRYLPCVLNLSWREIQEFKLIEVRVASQSPVTSRQTGVLLDACTSLISGCEVAMN